VTMSTLNQHSRDASGRTMHLAMTGTDLNGSGRSVQTERERVVRALTLGVLLGAAIALAARRRRTH
jgi:hypothetical protein